MPMDYSKYPPDWKAISLRIRAAADNKCIWCGVANKAVGARGKDGNWYDWDSIDCMQSDAGYALFGNYPNIIKIVLTVAHLDHDTTNNDDSNLACLCQRCHLNHDREGHIAKAKITRRIKRLERQRQQAQDIGQGMMEL